MTWWTLLCAVRLVPNGLPRVESIQIDGSVVLFAAATAFVVAVIAGAAPAIAAARTDVGDELRGGGRGQAGIAVRRSRRALVVVQVALAVS